MGRPEVHSPVTEGGSDRESRNPGSNIPNLTEDLVRNPTSTLPQLLDYLDSVRSFRTTTTQGLKVKDKTDGDVPNTG